MTNEEYINFANALKNNYTIDFDKLPEFCDMAISALSENKGDLISRQSLLNKINAYVVGSQDKEFICKLIKEMPSIENKGEWIEVVAERFPNGEKRMWHYDCSVCSTGEPPCPINKEHWDFCPNCGADMRPEPYGGDV